LFKLSALFYLLILSFSVQASETESKLDVVEDPDQPQAQEELEFQDTSFNLGGALRFNYSWKDYSEDSNGSFDFELFRIDLSARHHRWFFDGQYRFYKDFDTIHHAFIGYDINKNQQLTAGVLQVPFGIEPYASHSFWFGGTYYIGLEDDYDMGVSWRRTADNMQLDVAYFTGSEYRANEYGRYSFDVAAADGFANKEDGQLNTRFQYKMTPDHTLGVSGQLGQVKNTLNNASGHHWALAAHYNGHINDWNLQAEVIKYRYANKTGLGTDNHRIHFSAFLFPFEVATEAWVTSLNAAHTFDIENRFIDSVTCYNNTTLTTPSQQAGLADSIQNVSGCLLVKGGLYTYIDWIAGKNMWFAGGPGVGIDNGDTDWRSRLNINFGFYF
jgi:hypothetical protein